ncbi:acetyl-CoA carboxylase carboxyl transferase subunit alpha, partial [Myxococcus sp. AM009]|nr:acetyl-CoA carboxylase carboxyl transferase subunit alpha [Myxococcus sp. AM009]
GSGGALAIGVGNRVLMLQNSVYSVISPEGCASILFRDAAKADKAADAMRLTAKDLLEMKIIDEAIVEPAGGAHRDPAKMAEALGKTLRKHLGQLAELSPDELVQDRYAKFRALGVFSGR